MRSRFTGNVQESAFRILSITAVGERTMSSIKTM